MLATELLQGVELLRHGADEGGEDAEPPMTQPKLLDTWVWVKIKPGDQVLVHVSTYQGNPLWIHMLTHSHIEDLS